LVWVMTGLQPVVGSDLFFVGSPMLAEVQFNLDTGKVLLITTQNFSVDKHIASTVTINGVPIDMKNNAFVSVAQLTALPFNRLHFVFD